MARLVAFVGVIGSGKDYNCKKLVREGFVQVNFADPLRTMAWELLGYTPETEQDYEDFKKQTVFRNLTGRAFLQNLGTSMRAINVNFWADLWQQETMRLLCRGQDVCCSDLRYQNELQYFNSINTDFAGAHTSEVYFVDYRSHRYDANNMHKSEALARYIKNVYKLSSGDKLTEQQLSELIKAR